MRYQGHVSCKRLCTSKRNGVASCARARPSDMFSKGCVPLEKASATKPRGATTQTPVPVRQYERRHCAPRLPNARSENTHLPISQKQAVRTRGSQIHCWQLRSDPSPWSSCSDREAHPDRSRGKALPQLPSAGKALHTRTIHHGSVRHHGCAAPSCVRRR